MLSNDTENFALFSVQSPFGHVCRNVNSFLQSRVKWFSHVDRRFSAGAEVRLFAYERLREGDGVDVSSPLLRSAVMTQSSTRAVVCMLRRSRDCATDFDIRRFSGI
ncbi:hypothetical protein VTO73DRAFT_10843 [Trametes versicolor]